MSRSKRRKKRDARRAQEQAAELKRLKAEGKPIIVLQYRSATKTDKVPWLDFGT